MPIDPNLEGSPCSRPPCMLSTTLVSFHSRRPQRHPTRGSRCNNSLPPFDEQQKPDTKTFMLGKKKRFRIGLYHSKDIYRHIHVRTGIFFHSVCAIVKHTSIHGPPLSVYNTFMYIIAHVFTGYGAMKRKRT